MRIAAPMSQPSSVRYRGPIFRSCKAFAVATRCECRCVLVRWANVPALLPRAAPSSDALPDSDTFFSDTFRTRRDRRRRVGQAMPSLRPTNQEKQAGGDRPHSRRPESPVRSSQANSKASAGALRRDRRDRAQARRGRAAIAEARKSHERLREAIDILPQGIVFLDAEGRYILWNKKYAEIYNRSCRPVRAGRAAGGYAPRRRRARRLSGSDRPRGRMDRRAARASCISPASATSRRWPTVACILIEERLTDGRRRHRPARRHHRTEAARGLVPPAVRQQSGADDRLRAGRRAHSRRQRRRRRALRLQPRRIREADRSAACRPSKPNAMGEATAATSTPRGPGSMSRPTAR